MSKELNAQSFGSFLRQMKHLIELEEQKRQTEIQLVRAMHSKLCKSRREAGEHVSLDRFGVEIDVILAWLGLQPRKYYAWHSERKLRDQVEKWLSNMTEVIVNEE